MAYVLVSRNPLIPDYFQTDSLFNGDSHIGCKSLPPEWGCCCVRADFLIERVDDDALEATA